MRSPVPGTTSSRRNAIDLVPVADDTYWLGTATAGWKGLYLPDLKLYQLDANTLSLENAAGGTYKDFYLANLSAYGNSIGTTATDRVQLRNETNATAGAQQYSPALRFHGEGWKTNAAAGSQNVDFRIYLVPVQGAANPTGFLNFATSVNDAAFTARLALSTDGNLGLGVAAWGTNAAGVVGIGIGTAPTTAPEDMVQAWVADYAPGDARLYLRSEAGDGFVLGNNAIGIGLSTFQGYGNGLEIQGSAGYTALDIYTYSTTDAERSTITLGKSSSATKGTNSQTATGEAIGALTWVSPTGAGAWANVAIMSVVQNGAASNRSPVDMLISLSNGTNIPERLRIGTGGWITTLGAAPANVTAAGAMIAGGGIAFSDVLNAWIDDASHGTGTVTHYIGNAPILTGNGVNFGPAAVASITIVNGQVTNIS